MSARILVAMLSGCGVLCAATHYVCPVNPGAAYPYATWATAATNIQDAIDAASVTEEVVVTDGHYQIQATITVASEITVRSVNGAAVTRIDGGRRVRGLAVIYPKAVVDGFTITNGYPDGGVRISDGTVQHCVICDNVNTNSSYAYDGGAVLMTGGALMDSVVENNTSANAGGVLLMMGGTVLRCAIRNNTDDGAAGGALLFMGGLLRDSAVYNNRNNSFGGGGGVHCMNGDVQGCLITNNSGRGGGVYMRFDEARLASSTIAGNYGLYGGGVYVDEAATVSNCVVENNLAGDLGGGVRMAGGAVLTDCQILNNSATNFGGGVSANEAALMRNCVIRGNASITSAGGGVDVYDADPGTNCILRNCLVTGNRAQTSADGVFLAEGGLVENCTIVTNVGGHSGIVFAAGSVMDNSIVYGNSGVNMVSEESAASIAYCCTTPTNNIVGGAPGCTDRDPQLQDPPWNCRLMTNSPCRNTGIYQSWMAGANDLDDKPRILEGIVDMGAYEFAPYPIQRVTPTYFDFGEVALGAYADLEFTVENAGSSTLFWQVEALTMPPFMQYAMTSALPPYRWDWFRFAPDVLGPTSCATRILGNGGTNDIYLTGTGIVPEPLALGCYMLTACGAAWLTLRRRQAP